MARVRAVHGAAFVAHVLLIALVTAGILASTLPLGPRIAAASVAALPLFVAMPGLWRARRYTCQWLAVVLVLYCGGTTIEVVATSGTSYLPALVLLVALLELGMLVVLSRALRPTAPRG